jgi:hypothetical protein
VFDLVAELTLNFAVVRVRRYLVARGEFSWLGVPFGRNQVRRAIHCFQR